MATTQLCVPVTRPRAHKVKSRSHSARNTRLTTPFDVPVRMQKVQYSPSELLLLLLTNLIRKDKYRSNRLGDGIRNNNNNNTWSLEVVCEHSALSSHQYSTVPSHKARHHDRSRPQIPVANFRSSGMMAHCHDCSNFHYPY